MARKTGGSKGDFALLYSERDQSQTLGVLEPVVEEIDNAEEFLAVVRAALDQLKSENATRQTLIPSSKAGAIKQRIVGIVESAKMEKTIVVRRQRSVPHPKYKKIVKHEKKFYAHDAFNVAREGDFVQLVESRPLSKTKRWVLEAILRHTETKRKLPQWTQSAPLVRLTIVGLDDGSSLQIGAKYEVRLSLQNDQVNLFTTVDFPSPEGIDPIQLRGNKSGKPDKGRNIELDVTFGGFNLDISPRLASVRSAGGRPVIEPSTIYLTPASRKAEILLSVVARRSGEVIQTQTFKIVAE